MAWDVLQDWVKWAEKSGFREAVVGTGGSLLETAAQVVAVVVVIIPIHVTQRTERSYLGNSYTTYVCSGLSAVEITELGARFAASRLQDRRPRMTFITNPTALDMISYVFSEEES